MSLGVSDQRSDSDDRSVPPDDTLTADPAGGRQARADASGRAPSFGTRIGRFQVVNELGAGGMGVVVAALDPLLDRMVAVKLLRPGSFGEEATEKARTRLLREAQAMAKLSHPNVLPVFDAGEVGDDVFIAMELVAGGNLGQWLDEEKRSWREIVHKFILAGRGLAAAHQAGLVHRDFKPANVLVGKRGSVRVADFGLVATAGTALSTANASRAKRSSLGGESSLGETLTHTGAVLGTPRYMAPEQHLGEDTDARADQFSFCVALYAALYGQHPFAGDSYEHLAVNVLEDKLRAPPLDADVPAWVGEVVTKGLSHERSDRYESMQALLANLERDPGSTRRRVLAGAGAAAVILGLAAALVFVLLRSGSNNKDPCAGVDSELAGIWDAEVKASVEQAMLGSGRPHAKRSFERLSELLDAYAAEWTRLRGEYCEAASKAGEQADQMAQLRTVCLSQRRDELEAVTGLLAEEPDPKLTDKAILFALGMTRPSYCSHKGAAPVMIPPPDDPQLRARVAALRRELAKAGGLGFAGKYEAGLEITRRALAEARTLGYAPLVAEALFSLHRLQLRNWQLPEAAATAREAATVAERGHHDTIAAAARIQLLDLSVLTGGDTTGLKAEAEAAIERAGNDDRLRADLLGTVGELLYHQGKHHDAIEALRQSLAFFERSYPADHPAIPLMLNKLGGWLLNTGNSDQAKPYLERALAIYEQEFGSDHPELANTLDTMGWLHLVRGQWDDARGYFSRALAAFQTSLGSSHQRYWFVYLGLTLVELWQGKPGEARAAIDRWIAYVGDDAKRLAFATSVLGATYLDDGKNEEALSSCERAQALAKTTELEYRHQASIDLCLAQAHVALGQPERAIEPLEKSLDSWELDRQIPVNYRPAMRFTLARALWDSKRDRKHSVELAEQALAEYREWQAHGYRYMLPQMLAVQDWLRERLSQ